MPINLFLGATIALLPIYLKVTKIDFSRECKDYLLMAIFALLSLLLGNRRRGIPKYLYFIGAYFIIMGAMNQWNVASISVVITTFTFYITSNFIVRYYEGHDNESIQFIFDGMIFGSIIQSIFAIGGYFGYELYFPLYNLIHHITWGTAGSGPLNTVGTLGNVNLLASYLCLCIPAFFTRKSLLWLLPLPTYALLLSHGRMGIGALLAGVCYYLLIKFDVVSKAKIYLLTIIGMLAFPFLNLGLDNGRVGPWKRMIAESSIGHKVWGMGLGWFADSRMVMHPGLSKEAGNSILTMEHSAYLTIFNAFGLLGILLLLPIFIRYIRAKDDALLIPTILYIFFCNSYGHFSLQQSTVMVIIIPLVCIYGGQYAEKKYILP